MTPKSLLPLLAITATASALDWPQYRGPLANGITTEKVAPAAIKTPKVLWKVASEGGFSSFVVAGTKCFTIEVREADGAKQEALVARDVATGKDAWVAALNFPKYDGGGDSGTNDNKGGDGPRSTPTIVGDKVVVMSSQLVLASFNTADGAPAWKRDLLKEHAGRNIQWQNAASPLYRGGKLYVAGGGAGESLLCIDPKDGAVVWKAFDEKMTHATPVAANILGQPQVVFFVQSGLLAVEPATGKELWRYPFDYKISTAASPVVAGDIVYCSAGYGVGGGAVRISKDGAGFKATELYRKRGDKEIANHWSTPVLLGGNLYGMFQFKEYGGGPVKCVDVAKGDVKWTQPGFGPGHVILAEKQLLALSDAGELVLIDPQPGGYKELARADVLDGKCWTTPVLSGGRVFARSTKEAVCIEAGPAK